MKNQNNKSALTFTKKRIDKMTNALDSEKIANFTNKGYKCQIKRFDWIGYPYLCGYVYVKPTKRQMKKIIDDLLEK